MKAYKYIPLFALILACPVSAEKQTIVVSPDGPIATLEAARQKVRELKQQKPNLAIEVQIRDGIYTLRETVVFDPEDSGSEGAPVVYKAYPGEQPVFTGGIEIRNWKKARVDPVGTPKKSHGKLWAHHWLSKNAQNGLDFPCSGFRRRPIADHYRLGRQTTATRKPGWRQPQISLAWAIGNRQTQQ